MAGNAFDAVDAVGKLDADEALSDLRLPERGVRDELAAPLDSVTS